MSAGTRYSRPVFYMERSIGHGSPDVRGLYLNTEFYRSKGISRQERERLEIEKTARRRTGIASLSLSFSLVTNS